MKVLILCAGYATRLYPLTLNKPKHLLPIAGKPMLNYLIEKLEEVEEIDQIYLVTNQKFFLKFQEWGEKIATKKSIEVINDGTISDETKLGAIGDMDFVINKMDIRDDLLVVAGDNLFTLSVFEFVNFFQKRGRFSVVALHDVKNRELMRKYSEVRLNEEGRIVSFVEKPQKPQTTLAAICLYLFPKHKLYLIKRYLAQGNNPDQPGRYIQWLSQREPVYGYVFTEKWYDIGDLNQYKEADREYGSGGRKR